MLLGVGVGSACSWRSDVSEMRSSVACLLSARPHVLPQPFQFRRSQACERAELSEEDGLRLVGGSEGSSMHIATLYVSVRPLVAHQAPRFRASTPRARVCARRAPCSSRGEGCGGCAALAVADRRSLEPAGGGVPGHRRLLCTLERLLRPLERLLRPPAAVLHLGEIAEAAGARAAPRERACGVVVWAGRRLMCAWYTSRVARAAQEGSRF